MKTLKNVIAIASCLILSLLIVFGLRYLDDQNRIFVVDADNNTSLLRQEIISYQSQPRLYYKLFHSGELLGYISDLSYVEERIEAIYQEEYADRLKDVKMTFGEEYYISEEVAYFEASNIDDEIVDYLKEHEAFGAEVNIVEFSTDEGVYASIAVLDLDDFNEAMNDFLLNFIPKEDLLSLQSGETQEKIDDVGSRVTGYRIQENINSQIGVADIDDIMTNADEIFEYLCFGENKTRQYYTVKKGDTLQGVGAQNSDLSPEQIMLLNRDKIFSTDQVLEEGMELNVTYFTSPITVVVNVNDLKIRETRPESPLYIEDESLYSNVSEVIQEEENGSEYVLSEEVWINGVLLRGEEVSTSTIEEPTQAVIRVGTKPLPYVGTGTFMWPVENPVITCGWNCYPNHPATDVINEYSRYDKVYAADNGEVIANYYTSSGGYAVEIDHHNGFITYYGHMSHQSSLKVGDIVTKGQYIGDIGMTGIATGPHVHFEIRVDGVRQDPCDFMDCDAIEWR